MPVDFEQLARELIRALRGRRSQAAFARRLGFRSNVVYRWESGRAYPTAASTLQIAARVGVDVRAALQTFHRREPGWLHAHEDATSREAVAAFLDDLRGRTPVVVVARSAGLSRYRVARWLAAETEPRLPDFLRMIEVASLRLVDFVAALVDPTLLPSIRAVHAQQEAVRRAAYDVPWTQAVLRALELQSYRALPAHRPGWIAARLGIPLEAEKQCMKLLQRSRQIARRSGRYAPTNVQLVDTRSDPIAAARLRAFWAQVGSTRLAGERGGTFAYTVFGVSARDLSRIRELQTAYYRELRALIGQSEPVEHVALASFHLLPLSD